MSEPEKKPKKPRAPKITPALRPGLPKKEDGTYDWRKVVSPKNLGLNKNYWARQGKDVENISDTEIEELKSVSPDEGLVIFMGGFGEIAAKRGVKSVRYPQVSTYGDKSVVVAELTLAPNEDEPYEVVVSGVANCSPDNCSNKFVSFSEALASNRAINRAWRRYLNIQAVSEEELNPNEPKEEVKSIPDWHNIVSQRLVEHGLEESDIRGILEGKGISMNAKFDGTVRTMNANEGMTLIGILKK